VSRIEEQAKGLLSAQERRSIEITTYHSFCWSIVQSYGSLLYTHPYFKLLTPPSLAAETAGFSKEEVRTFLETVLVREGIMGFDLFAPTASTIVQRSVRIRNILSLAYPHIIVDEFQDTDDHEWMIVKLLGEKSRIIALADLEQLIFSFRPGVTSGRVAAFMDEFPFADRYDLGKENNRSSGTDIVQFGNDLLTGANKGKTYKEVKITPYGFYQGDKQKIALKQAVFQSIKRLNKSGAAKSWSIAILVRGKADTLAISTYLTTQSIDHDVIIDPSGPVLAAELIADLLSPLKDPVSDDRKLVQNLINHIKGRKGDRPSQQDLKLAEALQKYLSTGKIHVARRQIIVDIEKILLAREALSLSGIPEMDWLSIRRFFQDAASLPLQLVYEDARYLKLLHKGAALSEKLTEIWRLHGAYPNAGQAVGESLTQEHFAMVSRDWVGIFVMNIHKCKGKEFDEVIIWGEPFKPIVREDAIEEGKLLLRVAVTRARKFTTILTPAWKKCILL